jgi:nitrite reductase/ring-hydroxylating ferredoxin subunit
MLTTVGPVLSDGAPLRELVNLHTREVSLRVLADPEIHRLEMDQIFAKTWLLLGHETEIPKSGDFVVRAMGQDQVIVARDAKGQVHVSLNVCPHRGMRVCTAEAGNSQVHRCIYHGWAFRPNGDFIGAPIEKEQMHGDVFGKPQLGLRKARVHLYGGLIFATWNEDGPSFDEFLGDMKFYYDMLFCRTDGGLEVLGPPQRFVIPANWKTASEQAAADGFHTLTLHRSLMELGTLGSSGDTPDDNAPGMYAVDVGSAMGHALRCIPGETTFSMFMGRSDIKDLSTDQRLELIPPPGVTQGMVPELKRRFSAEQLRMFSHASPQVGGMFPNVLIAFIHSPLSDGRMGAALTLHTYVPRGPDHLEFINWIFAEKDTPEDIKREMLAVAIRQTGTSGAIEQDDADMWPHQSVNARGSIGRQETMKYQALLGENKPADWPGPALVYSGFTKDDTQWNWWQSWLRHMTA